jgi:modulator of FtsH protease HflC
VAEPLKFLNAVKTESNAENKLRNHINDTQNRVIGQHSFGEFVNSDPGKIQFDKIQEEMLADLKGPVLAEYGIEIKTLGIKQLKVSEDVTKQVFERMKAERQGRTDAITSEGIAIATQIRADANKKRDVLLDAAEGRAKEIRGQGDADAARYYEMLETDPKLAMFLRNLEAFKETTKDRTTIVVPTDAEPFNLLMGLPSLGTEGAAK